MEKSKQKLLEEYGVKPAKFILVEVAFLSERKGQRHLLKALQQIKKNHPNINADMVLFLVGDGEDYHALKEFTIASGLDDNVIFTGYVPNYCDFINACDIFFLPSVGEEDMPLVILSAMALKKAVIATKVAGISEEIEDGVSGKLLEVAHLDTLHEEILQLYKDESLRHYYCDNAFIRFSELFNRESVYPKFIDLYKMMTK